MSDEQKQVMSLEDSIKDISTQTDTLINKADLFHQVFTRAADPSSHALVEFHTMDESKMLKLAENMPEINRAVRIFGKQNSQTTNNLMSLTMIAAGPYRRLKQCLARIERKRGALKENIFKLRREKVRLDQLVDQREDLKLRITDLIGKTEPESQKQLKLLSYELQNVEIDIEEVTSNICDTNIYVEAALKEIGINQEAYREICTNYNIPENWDEKDFEDSEVEEHVKMAFNHGIRDILMTGRLNVGTLEYLEQYGINPVVALARIQGYLTRCQELVSAGQNPDITLLHSFLDAMSEEFKGEISKVLKRIGLNSLTYDDYLYKEPV